MACGDQGKKIDERVKASVIKMLQQSVPVDAIVARAAISRASVRNIRSEMKKKSNGDRSGT